MGWPDAAVVIISTLSVSWVILRLVQAKRYESEWSDVLDTELWNIRAKFYRAGKVLRVWFLPWWEMRLRQKKWERERESMIEGRMWVWSATLNQFQEDKEKIVALLEERREP